MGKKTKSFSIILLIVGVSLFSFGAIYPATLEKKITDNIPNTLNNAGITVQAHFDSVVAENTYAYTLSNYRDNLTDEFEEYIDDMVSISSFFSEQKQNFIDESERKIRYQSAASSLTLFKDEIVEAIPRITNYSMSTKFVFKGTQNAYASITNLFFNNITYSFIVDGITIKGLANYTGTSLGIGSDSFGPLLDGNMSSDAANVTGILSDTVLGAGLYDFIDNATTAIAQDDGGNGDFLDDLSATYMGVNKTQLEDIVAYFKNYMFEEIVPERLNFGTGIVANEDSAAQLFNAQWLNASIIDTGIPLGPNGLIGFEFGLENSLAILNETVTNLFDKNNPNSFCNATGILLWEDVYFGDHEDPMARYNSQQALMDAYSVDLAAITLLTDWLFEDYNTLISIPHYLQEEAPEFEDISLSDYMDHLFYDQWANLTSTTDGFLSTPLGIELPLSNSNNPSGLSLSFVANLFNLSNPNSLISENGSLLWMDAFENDTTADLDDVWGAANVELILDLYTYIDTTTLSQYFCSKFGIPLTSEIDPLSLVYTQWANSTVFKNGIVEAENFTGDKLYAYGLELGNAAPFLTNCSYISSELLFNSEIVLETVIALWDETNISSILSETGNLRWLSINKTDYDGLDVLYDLTADQMNLIIDWIGASYSMFYPSYLCRRFDLPLMSVASISSNLFAYQWLSAHTYPAGIDTILDISQGFEVHTDAQIPTHVVVSLFDSTDTETFANEEGYKIWKIAADKHSKHIHNPESDTLQDHFNIEDYYMGIILDWIDDNAIEMSNRALLEETGINNQTVALIFKFMMPLGFASMVACFVLLAKKKDVVALANM